MLPTILPSHTYPVFHPETFPKIVRWASKIVKAQSLDAIAACGHSGLLLAGAVSYSTGVKVIAVRKPSERPIVAQGARLNAYLPSGAPRFQRWAFLDDCIASGRTFRNVVEKVREYEVCETPLPSLVMLYSTSTTRHCIYDDLLTAAGIMDDRERDNLYGTRLPAISKDFGESLPMF